VASVKVRCPDGAWGNLFTTPLSEHVVAGTLYTLLLTRQL
jgi:hypothetical protein